MYHLSKSERRQRQVSELILEELSQVLENEVGDPRLAMVTITRVETTSDLRHSRVYFSTLGERKEREEALVALGGARGFLRSRLARGVSLQYVPEISFHLDDSLLYGQHIQELLGQMRVGEDGQEVPPSGQETDKQSQ